MSLFAFRRTNNKPRPSSTSTFECHGELSKCAGLVYDPEMLPWKNFAIEAPRAKRWFLRNADQPVGTLLCLLAGIAACAALDRHAWKIFAISFVLVYFAKRREVALLIGAILVSRVYPFFPIESFASGLGIERGNAYWPFIASFAVKFSTTALVVWYVIASERIANRFAHLRWIAPLALAVGALLAFPHWLFWSRSETSGSSRSCSVVRSP